MTDASVAKSKGWLSGMTGYFERADKRLPNDDDMVNARKPLIAGTIVILVTFFGFGVWASLAPIDSAALAPGVITVESNKRVVQHLEGGIIRDILVRDGSMVEAGDVLVRLDDIRARASLGILRNDYYSTLAIEARLIAERDGLPEPVFSDELLRHATDPSVTETIASQMSIFAARKSSLEGEKSILEQRISQYSQQIAGLEALQESKTSQIELINQELPGLRDLLKDGYVTKSRVLALEREASRLEGERGDHVAGIARARQGIGETEMQMLQIEKTRREEVTRELREVQSRLGETREKLLAAEDTFRRIDILAPVDGTVINLAFHTTGGVIGPGTQILEIVPSNDELIVEVRINPTDIDTVKPGQDVALRISTVDARTTPVIDGTLETISADRLVDPNTGTPYYKGKVVLSDEAVAKLGSLRLHSGMSVEALINRGEQTAMTYILKPLLDSLALSFKEK